MHSSWTKKLLLTDIQLILNIRIEQPILRKPDKDTCGKSENYTSAIHKHSHRTVTIQTDFTELGLVTLKTCSPAEPCWQERWEGCFARELALPEVIKFEAHWKSITNVYG